MKDDRKRCMHCKSPHWRTGPGGPRTLCNDCGVRYRSGLLVPEYRPVASPTFVPSEAKAPPPHAARKKDGRRCMHCETDKTPRWRTGPMGRRTLCNACGVRYRSGLLVPEYRPAASPTFVLSEHSNSRRKALQLPTAAAAAEPSSSSDIPVPTPISVRRKRKSREPPAEPSSKSDTMAPQPKVSRRCLHCQTDKTPQWRMGPEGPRTLCNACGVHYSRSGWLVPEYRPLASPTFVLSKHSNSLREVLELRCHKEVTDHEQQQQ